VERRTFLVLGAAALGLAGCSDRTDPPPPSAPAVSSAPTDPDARLRDEVAASEVALISAYRAALRSAPELAADLAPFLAHHEAHLDKVAPGYPRSGEGSAFPSASGSPSGSGPGSGSGSPSASGSPSGSRSPSGAAEGTSEPSASVLAALVDAETGAQAQRAAACDGAQDPGLVRELCLIAASEAQHATALEALAAAGTGS
jgi:hypothetical protein